MSNPKVTSFFDQYVKGSEEFNSRLFRSTVANAELKIKGICHSGKPIYCLYSYDEAQNESLLCEKILTVNPDGTFSYIHSFDPTSLAVYQNATCFCARLTGIEDSEILNIELREYEQEATEQTEPKPRRVRGPKPLRNVLFIGNSLLLGLECRYGMCSSSPRNDYFYHVSQAISAEFPDCTFHKLHGSPIEHAETPEAFEEAFYKTENFYTKRPFVESLTPDLDLIILQISDNVNTDAKIETFHKTAPLLLERMRKLCPHAEIVWVYGWYHKRQLNALLSRLFEDYDVEPADIRPLRYRANEAPHGQLYESIDGTKKVASDLWITHPGDNGMRMIGEMIVSILKETKLLS
jgi:hypothetical protein